MTSTRSLTKFSRAFNRQSVQGAIRALQTALKRFKTIPTNGIALFAGVQPIASSADGGVTPISSATSSSTSTERERLMVREIEPLKPLRTGMYYCDGQFHIEPLLEQLSDETAFGYVILDGSGCHMYSVCGESYKLIWKHGDPSLPKKHGRGGQSALRFARLRLEKRHNYLRKVAELAVTFFIVNDKPNVTGLVLAGLADFKNELSLSDMFDPRLAAKVIKIVDVSYGGENGFNQAIELCGEALANVKFIQEKKLITAYFDEIAQDTGKYVFGVEDTLKGLEMGAIETLIVWENLEVMRYLLKNTVTGEEKVIHLLKDQEKDPKHFHDEATSSELEIVESLSLLEWLANNYKKFGAKLEFVTNKSQEGSQFCKGFGGIGGVLRYKLDIVSLTADENPFDEF